MGGGVGGLFTAHALARAGLQVTVLEQAFALTEVGAGLQLAPNATRLLSRAGLLDSIVAKAVRPVASHLRTARSDRAVLRYPLGAVIEARHQAPYLHVHRADLLDTLKNAVATTGAEIRLNARVVHATAENCTLENGEVIEHDLLVGADGVKSTIRQIMTAREGDQETELEFTGSIAWRATFPSPPTTEQPLTEIWMAPGRHLVSYKLRGGTLTNLVAVEDRDEWTTESWSQPGDPNLLLRTFSDFAHRPRSLLSSVENCFIWGIFNHPAPETMAKGNFALLGDAAHAAPPFGAQGAAMAIEDGAALAKVILVEQDLETALKRYSKARCARVTDVLNWSLSNGRMFHQSNLFQRAFNYAYLGVGSRLSPGTVAQRMDWLYGYDAELEV